MRVQKKKHLHIEFIVTSHNGVIVNFIIEKLKSKHTSLKKYTNWAKIFFSRFEGTRGERNQIFRTLDNNIECGLLCAFNDECDFFLYQGRNCYLASYNTTGRGLFGDSIDSSEIACYQNSSKIILLKLFSLTKIISLKFKPQQRMASSRKSCLM